MLFSGLFVSSRGGFITLCVFSILILPRAQVSVPTSSGSTAEFKNNKGFVLQIFFYFGQFFQNDRTTVAKWWMCHQFLCDTMCVCGTAVIKPRLVEFVFLFHFYYFGLCLFHCCIFTLRFNRTVILVLSSLCCLFFSVSSQTHPSIPLFSSVCVAAVCPIIN